MYFCKSIVKGPKRYFNSKPKKKAAPKLTCSIELKFKLYNIVISAVLYCKIKYINAKKTTSDPVNVQINKKPTVLILFFE